jgi:hypothetical protein
MELGIWNYRYMNQYKGYKELECYKQARLLRIFISDLVRKFPLHENLNLYLKWLIHPDP